MTDSNSVLEEWIGKKKQYKEAPVSIKNELLRRLQLSLPEMSLLPAKTITIPRLLEFDIPSIEPLLSHRKGLSCFTNEPATCSLSDIAKEHIPNVKLIKILHDSSGQAMLDGHVAIRLDWHGRKSVHRNLPFNAITLWLHLHEASLAKEKWSLALDWVRRQSIPEDLIYRVECAINQTPWSGRVESLGAGLNITDLATFLSRDMLSDSHIDLMVQLVSIRLNADVETAARNIHTHIECTDLAQALTGIASYIERYPIDASSVVLHAATNLLLGLEASPSNVATICGVAHSEPMHYGAYSIEISSTRLLIKWGDSISSRRIPTDFVKGLRKWASCHFKGLDVVFDESSLQCGVQDDGYSCGIISVNTLKHLLFHDPLWVSDMRETIRVNEFVDILEYHLIHIGFRLHRGLLLPKKTLSDDAELSEADSDVQIVSTHLPVICPLSTSPPSVISIPEQSNIRFKQLLSSDSSEIVKKQIKKRQVPREVESASESEKPSKKKARSGERKTLLNEAVAAGDFTWNPAQREAYKLKLHALDPHFSLNTADPKQARNVRHSVCGQFVVMSVVYDVSRFKEHIKRCKNKIEKDMKKNPARNTLSLVSMFSVPPPRKVTAICADTSAPASAVLVPTNPDKYMVPCPGLPCESDARIKYYVQHTQVDSGGGKSEISVAQEMYGAQYSSLSEYDKKQVTLRQKQGHRWRIDHITQRIFALGEEKTCLKNVWQPFPSRLASNPCVNCQALFSLPAFQNAIVRKRSEDKKANFVPIRNRNVDVAKIFVRSKGLQKLFAQESTDHIFARFVHQYTEGHFQENDTFLGMLNVMVTKTYRRTEGKGLQNMYYPPSFDTLAHEILCVSPAAYRTFQMEFGGRSERSFRAKRAKAPAFIQGNGPHTAERAIKYLTDFGYPLDAPLGSAVDDTKLLASCRPVYNNQHKCWYLVGGTGDPVRIANIAQLQDQLDDLRRSQATKLRLWTLSIPLPGIPPLVLSASPIGNKNSGADLAEMEMEMINEVVLNAGLILTSLASDGAGVERDARRILVRTGYAKSVTYSIQHPCPGYSDIVIELLEVHGRRIAVVQDSKHLRKTLWNNLFSGAKALVLGNSLISFQLIWEMAHHKNSPIYLRDVKKLDRQDDRAAARLFSAQVLGHLVKTTNNIGLIVYLYTFGDLVDAYQSRTMSHRQRVKVVLRAKFFKDLWKLFLKDAGYSARHFLSPEADDITDILINGFMGLVYIYRDDLKGQYPLLPWEKTSEANEHCFGGLREMTPDFTFADILFLIPKLGVRLMAACKRKIPSVEFRKTASGYMHTYADGSDANLYFLRLLPSDMEINLEAAVAWDEAVSLWDILGYTVDTPDEVIGSLQPQTYVDGISTPDDDEDTHPSDQQELQDALDSAILYQSTCSPGDKADTAIDECSFAAAALRIADFETFKNLPVDNPDSMKEIKDALSNVLAALSSQGPSAAKLIDELLRSVATGTTTPMEMSAIEDEDITPLDEDAWTSLSPSITHVNAEDLTPLVDARRETQSRECAKSVRIRSTLETDSDSGNCSDAEADSSKKNHSSDRQILAQKIHDIIRMDAAEQGTSTGLNRRVRHTTEASSVQTQATTGNASNAKAVSRVSAAAVIDNRQQFFAGIILGDELSDARINMFSPLKSGCYGVVMVDKDLMIAQVITIYERSGGKTARHNFVESSASIGAISYIPVQLWQYHRLFRFRALFGKTGKLNMPCYAHIAAASFLYMLPEASVRLLGKGPGVPLDLTKAAFKDIWAPLEEDKDRIHIGVERILAAHRKRSDLVEEDE